jgi:AMP nucleosidase
LQSGRTIQIENVTRARYRPAMKTTDTIIAELVRVYDEAVATLRADVAAFAASGTLPPPDRRETRAWCYPELRISYNGIETRPDLARAFGQLTHTGGYTTTITRPALFADYLIEQLSVLAEDYEIEVSVGRS